jgi:hypothetical protein
MSLIIPANSAAAGGGFTAANSLMFNYADSAYLNRTLGTPTNNKRWTWSAWIKRSRITAAVQRIFFAVNGSDEYTTIQFDDEYRLQWFNQIGGATDMQLITTRNFKDPSAWYHLMFVYDSANSTAADRQIIYVNGVRETVLAQENTAGSNADTVINQAVVHNIASGPGAANFYGGYMSEVVFTDGQALAVTDVGEFDEDSSIWKPISVSGLTFGNNGFYLDFEDSSALGNDAAGSNNFTANNLAATDQGTDTCTNNFATMNPLNNHIQNQTFSQGNLQTLTDNPAPATSTIGLTSGKWWIEAKGVSSGSGSDYQIGIVSNQVIANEDIGHYSNNYSYYYNGKLKTGNVQSSYGNTYTHGDIIGVALNLDDTEVQVYKNGTVQNSGTAISITAPASTELGAYFFALGADANATKYTLHTNFGSPHFAISSGNADGDGFGNFEYAVPSGFFALCTKNLAEYG